MIKRKNKILGVQLDFYSQLAIFCLAIIILVGLFSNLIANTKPLILNDGEGIYFPAFSNKFEKKMASKNGGYFDWNEVRYLSRWMAPVPYSAGESDVDNANYQPPFAINNVPNPNQVSECPRYPQIRFRHWLGTNLKGDDLLSGLIHGTSVSLKIGFFSILIAIFIGTIMGIVSGYFQNDTLKIPWLSFVFILFSIIPSIYLADLFSFFLTQYFHWQNTGMLIGTLAVYLITLSIGILKMYWLGKLIHYLIKWKRKIHVPVDVIISRLIEIFAAIPKLMLIVALAALLTRGVNNVIIIIGISSWAGIARLIRAETLKLRNQDFITSAKALGLSNFKIMYKHLLPNIAGPIMVSFVFGMSAAILIESGLSFLNIGVPEGVITWGQLLADGKRNFNAWWLIVFPGLAIFTTVFCLNILGEKFKSMLDPANKGLT